MHVADALMRTGRNVIGIDAVNAYYDPSLKEARLSNLDKYDNFQFFRTDIVDFASTEEIFEAHNVSIVIHLAAQAGVRYSLENPSAYIDSNIRGFLNILECCRRHSVEHLVYASSSSVYGGNIKLPFSEGDNVDHPLSLYAATKKSNELMAHCYSHLYRLPTTGLRFFTVYGPWGRPDMALFLFTKAILAGEPISVFNEGNMVRDFTYIDDIVQGVIRVADKAAQPLEEETVLSMNPSTSTAPFRVFNIGNGNPQSLMAYIDALEKKIGKKAIKRFEAMQPGDVVATEADTEKLFEWVGYEPATDIEEGIGHFVDWYRAFYA